MLSSCGSGSRAELQSASTTKWATNLEAQMTQFFFFTNHGFLTWLFLTAKKFKCGSKAWVFKKLPRLENSPWECEQRGLRFVGCFFSPLCMTNEKLSAHQEKELRKQLQHVTQQSHCTELIHSSNPTILLYGLGGSRWQMSQWFDAVKALEWSNRHQAPRMSARFKPLFSRALSGWGLLPAGYWSTVWDPQDK